MARNVKKNPARSTVLNQSLSENEETLSIAYFERRFGELQNSLASKEDVANLTSMIKQQQVTITKLEKRIVDLESEVSSLHSRTEEGEQYSRRLCLRIDGIPVKSKETADEIRTAVSKVAKECGVVMPDEVIDRAHRIGKGKVIAGKTERQVIVRFTSFHYRTVFYKARKTSKKFRVYLDLTKHRKDLLSKINIDLAEKQTQDCFAFADVNCRLCVKLGDSFHYISNYEEYLQLFV